LAAENILVLINAEETTVTLVTNLGKIPPEKSPWKYLHGKNPPEKNHHVEKITP